MTNEQILKELEKDGTVNDFDGNPSNWRIVRAMEMARADERIIRRIANHLTWDELKQEARTNTPYHLSDNEYLRGLE